MSKKALRDCLSPDERWRDGTPHDPRSVEILDAMKKVQRFHPANVDIRCGGDGDLGEELLYLLDIAFEAGLL